MGSGEPNRMLRWGIGVTLGAFLGNLVAWFGFGKPWAEFFTDAWWERWTMIYAIGFAAVGWGLVVASRRRS